LAGAEHLGDVTVRTTGTYQGPGSEENDQRDRAGVERHRFHERPPERLAFVENLTMRVHNSSRRNLLGPAVVGLRHHARLDFLVA